MRSSALAALVTIVAGCADAPRYAYRPTKQAALEDAPGDLAGYAAATYPLPQGAPHGEARIAALGVIRLRLPQGRVRALHVRMIVHNGDRELWTVDATAQKAVLDSRPAQGPLSATIDGDGVSLAVLMPGDTRTFDLYYALPEDVVEVPELRIEWRVETPAGVIAARTTPFERHEVAPPPASVSKPRTKPLEDPSPNDDGMPQPGRAEATGWPSWRD